MQRKMRNLLPAIAFVIGAALAACSHPPDETRIRNAIAALMPATIPIPIV